MATPAQLQIDNIRRSFQKAILDRVETPNTTPSGKAYASNWIDYDDELFDPSLFEQYARIDFVDEAAGSFSWSIVQITCVTRRRVDRFGQLCDQMLQLFRDAMKQSPVGQIQVYDFTVPASPVVVSNKWLLIQNSDGKLGEQDGGVARRDGFPGTTSKAITFRFKIMPDDYSGEQYRAAG